MEGLVCWTSSFWVSSKCSHKVVRTQASFEDGVNKMSICLESELLAIGQSIKSGHQIVEGCLFDFYVALRSLGVRTKFLVPS